MFRTPLVSLLMLAALAACSAPPTAAPAQPPAASPAPTQAPTLTAPPSVVTTVAAPTATAPAPTAAPTALPPTPTVPATPDPNEGVGEIVYQDALDGSGRWFWSYEDDAVRFLASPEEKQLTGVAKRSNTWRFSTSPDTLKIGNQQLRVSARANVCADRDEYALLFRGGVAAETQAYSFYAFKLRCDGQARLERLQGTESVVLTDWTASPAILAGAGQENALTVWAGADELRFYVNGQYLFSTRDAALTDGFYGFLLHDRTNGNMSVSWKQLEVREVVQP